MFPDTTDSKQTEQTDSTATDGALQGTSREFTDSNDDQQSVIRRCINGWTDPQTSRREVLGTIGALFGGAATASGSAAAVPGASATVDDSEDSVLGDFEDGFDKWSVNGDHELFQTPAEEVPAAVTTGSSALGVALGRAAKPRLENRDRIAAVDLEARPYLVADVLPAVADAEQITIQLLIQARGSGVHRSQEHTIPNGISSRVYWNATELSEEVRARATRLSIELSTDRSHQGNENGVDSVRGFAFLDSIRASDNPAAIGNVGSRNAIRELTLKRGIIEEFVTDERSEDYERGRIEFADGTSVPYEHEILAPQRVEYTIQGETYKTGGGW